MPKACVACFTNMKDKTLANNPLHRSRGPTRLLKSMTFAAAR
jgi:hypothetical protein